MLLLFIFIASLKKKEKKTHRWLFAWAPAQYVQCRHKAMHHGADNRYNCKQI